MSHSPSARDEIVFIVTQDEQDSGYTAACHAHNIFTQGDDLDDLRAMVKDAVACHFGDDARPTRIRLHFVRDEVLV